MYFFRATLSKSMLLRTWYIYMVKNKFKKKNDSRYIVFDACWMICSLQYDILMSKRTGKIHVFEFVNVKQMFHFRWTLLIMNGIFGYYMTVDIHCYDNFKYYMYFQHSNLLSNINICPYVTGKLGCFLLFNILVFVVIEFVPVRYLLTKREINISVLACFWIFCMYCQ